MLVLAFQFLKVDDFGDTCWMGNIIYNEQCLLFGSITGIYTDYQEQERIEYRQPNIATLNVGTVFKTIMNIISTQTI